HLGQRPTQPGDQPTDQMDAKQSSDGQARAESDQSSTSSPSGESSQNQSGESGSESSQGGSPSTPSRGGQSGNNPGASGGQPDLSQLDMAAMQKLLERLANRKREYLDQLPKDLGGT